MKKFFFVKIKKQKSVVGYDGNTHKKFQVNPMIRSYLIRHFVFAKFIIAVLTSKT